MPSLTAALAGPTTPLLLGIALLFGACLPSAAGQSLNSKQQELLKRHIRHGIANDRIQWTSLDKSTVAIPIEMAQRKGLRYAHGGQDYTLDDYFERQPVTGLLIWKSGKLVFERYQHGGSRSALFLSNSMAKSLVGISIAKLEDTGALRSQDILAGDIVPELAGTVLGNVTIRNHMRIGSGVKYSETYAPGDDHSRFVSTVSDHGLRAGFRLVTEQEVPEGTRFYYAGVSSNVLSEVVGALSGKNAAAYFGKEIWSRLGTESRAYWAEDVNGRTQGYCCFLARPRDYLRLGIVLSNGGKRPDTGEQIIPAALLDRLAEPGKFDPPFKAPAVKNFAGYDSQFWISSLAPGAFTLIGLYGQRIYVFPKSSLVIVHFAMTGDTSGNNNAILEMASMVRGMFRALR